MLSYVRLMTMRFVRNLVSGGFIEVFQLQNRCLDTVLCRLAVYSLLKYCSETWLSATPFSASFCNKDCVPFATFKITTFEISASCKGKLFVLLSPSLILCDLSFPTAASSSSVETTFYLENMVAHNLC